MDISLFMQSMFVTSLKFLKPIGLVNFMQIALGILVKVARKKDVADAASLSL